MHVVAFNGSPRKNGNTARLVRHCLDTLESEGISTEMVQVGGTNIRGCCSCLSCRKKAVEVCAITSDPFNEWIRKNEECRRDHPCLSGIYVWDYP